MAPLAGCRRCGASRAINMAPLAGCAGAVRREIYKHGTPSGVRRCGAARDPINMSPLVGCAGAVRREIYKHGTPSRVAFPLKIGR